MPDNFPNQRAEDDPRLGLPGRAGAAARRLRLTGAYLRERLPSTATAAAAAASGTRVSRTKLILTVYIVLVIVTFAELMVEFSFASARLAELRKVREGGSFAANDSNLANSEDGKESTASLPPYEGDGWAGRVRAFMLMVIHNVIVKDSESSPPSTPTLSVHEESILAELMSKFNNHSMHDDGDDGEGGFLSSSSEENGTTIFQ